MDANFIWKQKDEKVDITVSYSILTTLGKSTLSLFYEKKNDFTTHKL